MSIFEYDKEEEEKKLRKAEYEAGREIGEREGRITGEKIGRIAGMIDIFIELDVPENDIIAKLQEKMQISKEDAQKYLEKYKGKKK